MSVQAYIGLGSNLENPAEQIQTALNEINQLLETRLIKSSGLFRSKPMGPQDQPDYLNAVALIETALDETALLDNLQQIENRHGRERTRHWGERTLDLDILLYADLMMDTPRLTIPHPGVAEREFVLYPLQKINPELEIPGKGKLQDLIKQCPANDIVFLGH